jgi:protein TonB
MYGVSTRGATRAPAALALIAAALIAGACSKGEPQSGKAVPNAPVASRAAPAPAPAPDAVDAALKERLARQEAASRMFERHVLEPPAPRAPEAPKAAAPKVEPKPEARTEAPPEAKPLPRPEAKVESKQETKPEARPEPRAEPKREAPPAPIVTAAKAAPAAPRLVSRVDPDFPAEALRAGVERGSVRARMTLDGNGNVTSVDVLEATPRRVFDRAVVRALSQWKYNDGAAGRTVESEIDFRR